MPANTDYQDGGYTVFSNISLNGSAASLAAKAIAASTISSSGTIQAAAVWSSGFSALGSIATVSRVSSDVSILANEVWASGVSVGSLCTASGFSSAGTTKTVWDWTSRLSVGGSSSAYTGTEMLAFSYISTLGVAMVVQGSASSETIFVWPAVRPGDWIGVTVGTGVAISSLSSGLVYHSHCTVAGQCNVRISNVSTLVQNQTAQTLSFYRISTA